METRPRPPELPYGWTAVWDDEYKIYFYYNEYTELTQWEIPTETERAQLDPPPYTQRPKLRHSNTLLPGTGVAGMLAALLTTLILSSSHRDGVLSTLIHGNRPYRHHRRHRRQQMICGGMGPMGLRPMGIYSGRI